MAQELTLHWTKDLNDADQFWSTTLADGSDVAVWYDYGEQSGNPGWVYRMTADDPNGEPLSRIEVDGGGLDTKRPAAEMAALAEMERYLGV